MNVKIYNALDVARYIINKCNQEDSALSNLKLQKVLYFVQANFLLQTEDNHPCFGNRIEAWNFGPVIPDVYHEFKRFGSSSIPAIEEYMDFSDGLWNAENKKYTESIIEKNDRILIDEMVEQCKKYSATDLVNITHNQKPWKDAYSRGYNIEITNAAILEYYKD